VKRRHVDGTEECATTTTNVVLPLALRTEMQQRAEAGERFLSAEIRLAIKSWLEHPQGQLPAKQQHRREADIGKAAAAAG
jgi:hypothetical protein